MYASPNLTGPVVDDDTYIYIYAHLWRVRQFEKYSASFCCTSVMQLALFGGGRGFPLSTGRVSRAKQAVLPGSQRTELSASSRMLNVRG